MGEIIFKTELIKGAKGDRGEAGQADSIPTDGVIAFQGETVPDGYEETDPGDVFDEVYEDINAVKDMISDEYDTTATYNAGNYCIHENALYKCTATTTGLWDSSKWVLTSASDETKANAEAIEAMVNVTGSCNILPYNEQNTASATVTFNVNNDGSVTGNGTPTSSYPYITLSSFTLKAGTYILDSGVPAQTSLYVNLKDSGGNALANTYEGKKEFTIATDTSVVAYIYLHGLESVSNVTIYPMLYDARLNPTGYVPYAMTNRELTERVDRGSVLVAVTTSMTRGQAIEALYAAIDWDKIRPQSYCNFLGEILIVRYLYKHSTYTHLAMVSTNPGGIDEINNTGANQECRYITSNFSSGSYNQNLSSAAIWENGNIILYY